MEIFEKDTLIIRGKCVLVFGKFDGVHKGHQHLMNEAKRYAEENDLYFGVYTFLDSPKFINPDHSLLTDLQTRISLIDYHCSPDFVYLENFDDIKSYSPCEFVDYIIDIFDCECAFCGENFRFGNKASGSSSDLVSLMQSKDRNAVAVVSLMDEGMVISSTYIRSLLACGDVQKASELLSKPFGFTSKVVHGASLGHKLGFPTVNQVVPKEIVSPKFGVYATCVIYDGKEYFGVTNFGVKPTVSGDTNSPVAETYIIDFDEDVYGKYVTVLFCKMLREERKFSSIEELKQNIEFNVKQTIDYFKEFYEKK